MGVLCVDTRAICPNGQVQFIYTIIFLELILKITDTLRNYAFFEKIVTIRLEIALIVPVSKRFSVNDCHTDASGEHKTYHAQPQSVIH